MKNILWLACGIIFISCLTSLDEAPPYRPPLSQVLINDLEGFLAQQEYLATIQLADRLEREEAELPASRLKELKEQAIVGARAKLNKALAEGQLEEALALFRALEVVAAPKLLDELTIEELYLQLAARQELNGAKKIALYYYLEALAQSAWDKVNLNKIATLAYESNEIDVLKNIVQRMEKKGLLVENRFRQKAGQLVSISQMVSGTVTIWVNKGTKLESGVGLPDRVIGSGFFIDERGYLLTNYHVIQSEVDPNYEGYSRLYVKLAEKPEQRIPATVIGFDPILDLALLKVPYEPKYIFPLLKETRPELAERITVIGSPLGLTSSATSGIISALDRRFLQIGEAIQIDAPVNPGNSGGPVIDASGNLVGIVFAGVPQFQGINFAVAGEWLKLVLPKLYNGGQVKHFWLGAVLAETGQGLEIIYVLPGEPADNAGLKSGDIILSLNGRELKKVSDFQKELEYYPGKSLIKLGLKREERSFAALVYLKERPLTPMLLALERDARSNLIYPLFGMKIERQTDSTRLANYLVRHVLPDSSADELGITENDPLDIRNWYMDKDKKIVAIEVMVKKKKAGYLETYVQLMAMLEIDSFV